MKHISVKAKHLLPLLFAAAIAFAGCEKEGDNEPAPAQPLLSAVPPSISAPVVAGSHAIIVTSNVEWTAAVNSEAVAWCTVSPLTGSGNGAVIVNVTENTTFESRPATVTISAGTLTQQVGVTQVGIAPALMTDKSAIEAPHATSYYAIAVTSNTGWTAAVNNEAAEWCTVSPLTGSGNGSVLVTVAENLMAVPRAATITFTAGTLTCTISVAQEPADPTLTVDRTIIGAAHTGGNFPIAVTSNAHWTATVNSEAAAWCTVSPEAGLGSDVVMVNVMESTAPRAATVTISAGPFIQTVAIMQQSTPPYAASTTIWIFDTQTWSDAIHVPECNKEDFTSSNTDPQCRSYIYAGVTRYYYNWLYVDANKEEMCPSPWRVPTVSDLNTLVSNVTAADLIDAWGYGGIALGTMNFVDSYALYWSSTEDSNTSADLLQYSSDGLHTGVGSWVNGLQVRCVK